MLVRDRLRSSYIWFIPVAFLVPMLVRGFMTAPSLSGAISVAAFLAVLAWIHPITGVMAVVLIDGLMLLFQLAGLNAGQVWYGSFVLLLIALASSCRFMPPALRNKVFFAALTLVFILVFGGVVASRHLHAGQILEGMRYVATPLLCGLIGMALGGRGVASLLRVGTIVVVISAVAAGAQRVLGADSLISLGLQLGTAVRTFDGVIRAPGLFATNYSMGAFAGVMAAVAIVWWPTIEQGRGAAIWRSTAIVGSLTCLFFSIYRTGMLLLGVSVLLWIIFARGQGSVIRKLFLSALGIIGAAMVFRSGFGSNSSYLERLYVWDDVLSSTPPSFLGYGIGFSGAASGSRFSDTRVAVDNYFISLVLQFGVVSIFLVVPLLVLALWMTVRSTSFPVLRSGMSLIACFVAFFFVEYWEYTGAMSTLIYSVGCAIGLYTAGRSPGMEDKRQRQGERGITAS